MPEDTKEFESEVYEAPEVEDLEWGGTLACACVGGMLSGSGSGFTL
jgi:hypothetical protein